MQLSFSFSQIKADIKNCRVAVTGKVGVLGSENKSEILTKNDIHALNGVFYCSIE